MDAEMSDVKHTEEEEVDTVTGTNIVKPFVKDVISSSDSETQSSSPANVNKVDDELQHFSDLDLEDDPITKQYYLQLCDIRDYIDDNYPPDTSPFFSSCEGTIALVCIKKGELVKKLQPLFIVNVKEDDFYNDDDDDDDDDVDTHVKTPLSYDEVQFNIQEMMKDFPSCLREYRVRCDDADAFWQDALDRKISLDDQEEQFQLYLDYKARKNEPLVFSYPDEDKDRHVDSKLTEILKPVERKAVVDIEDSSFYSSMEEDANPFLSGGETSSASQLPENIDRVESEEAINFFFQGLSKKDFDGFDLSKVERSHVVICSDSSFKVIDVLVEEDVVVKKYQLLLVFEYV